MPYELQSAVRDAACICSAPFLQIKAKSSEGEPQELKYYLSVISCRRTAYAILKGMALISQLIVVAETLHRSTTVNVTAKKNSF